MKCGLLGYPLDHSYSPQIHNLLGNYSYQLFSVESHDLDTFFKNADFAGINVTSPYKKSVVQYCHELTPAAQTVGSVNTIIRRADGKLIGHNTDYFGFTYMLKDCGVKVAGKKVLILGSGGAARTVYTVLAEQHAMPVIISRSGENNYTNLDLHTDASVIINATPVGMYPETLVSPIQLDIFAKLEAVLDLIYNPAKTKLLLDAEKRGLIIGNGLSMLVAQAKESAELFTGAPIDDVNIQKIQNSLDLQMRNIILIGMPGCGKTTIGKRLAKYLGREFIDTDDIIAFEQGISIPEIIEKLGEDVFRQLESEVISRFSKRSSLVISTGGGCVTNDNNYYPIRQNSRIYWIKRDLNLLPTEGRPLSMQGTLENMYRLREPKYIHYSDYVLDNNTSTEQAVQRILTMEGHE